MAKKTKTKTSADSNIEEVLNLSFPRCSCCKTEWYQILNDDDDINNQLDKGTMKRSTKRRSSRPSHLDLLQMPRCDCTTRLVQPPLPFEFDYNKTSSFNGLNNNDLLSRIQIVSFPSLPICRICLTRRIAASQEVTVHDYRMGHIVNGQQDVRFTVELCCVQCKRKFSVRSLERLLNNNNNNDHDVEQKKKKLKKSSSSDVDNWQDGVDATIRLIGWAKCGLRRDERLRRRRCSNSNNNNNSYCYNSSFWKDMHGSFTGGDDNCSSDECFSLSSSDDSENDDDYCDDGVSTSHSATTTTKQTRGGPRRVELKSGELMKELLAKDPLYRQEREDEECVKRLLEEEEKELRRASAARSRDDEELAKRLLDDEEEERRRLLEQRSRQDEELAKRILEEEEEEALKRRRTSTSALTASRTPSSSTLKKTTMKKTMIDAWRKPPSSCG